VAGIRSLDCNTWCRGTGGQPVSVLCDRVRLCNYRYRVGIGILVGMRRSGQGSGDVALG
jgi:hypothetical protein